MSNDLMYLKALGLLESAIALFQDSSRQEEAERLYKEGVEISAQFFQLDNQEENVDLLLP